MVGKDAASQYWIVMEPASHKGCWIAAGQAREEGDISTLPELVPGPTLALTPEAPENLKASAVCSREGRYRGVKITVSWEDRSNNETGFELQKNRAPYKDFEKDTVSYSEFIRLVNQQSGSIIFWLRAVNENGKSKMLEAIVTFFCK